MVLVEGNLQPVDNGEHIFHELRACDALKDPRGLRKIDAV